MDFSARSECASVGMCVRERERWREIDYGKEKVKQKFSLYSIGLHWHPIASLSFSFRPFGFACIFEPLEFQIELYSLILMYILFNCKYEFSLVASQTHDKYSFTSTLCQCAADKLQPQQRQQQNASTENRLHTIYFFDFFVLAYFFVLTFWRINSTKWSLEVYAVDVAHSYPSYTKSVCRCQFISIPQIKWNFCHISANSTLFSIFCRCCYLLMCRWYRTIYHNTNTKTFDVLRFVQCMNNYYVVHNKKQRASLMYNHFQFHKEWQEISAFLGSCST